MIAPFVYTTLPQRILFGAGRMADVAGELTALGCHRALVLSTADQAASGRRIAELLGAAAGGLFANAAMHTPTDVTEAALLQFTSSGCDSTVAIGGGSTTGLGKALALRTDCAQIVLPTTYAGSEVTAILGQTENGVKSTQRSLRVLPETVIYDVDLTLSLPARLSAVSGMNAIAHAVEALYARDANPIVSLMAEEGIRALAASLPVIRADLDNHAARTEAQYGAWLCGACLGLVGMALHHKICHVLGGTFDLPHAETHAIILPHVANFNESVATVAMDRVARALGAGAAGIGLFDLNRRLGVPVSLREVGMPADGIDRAVQQIMATPYWNPRVPDAASLQNLLRRAFDGLPPATV